MFLRLKLLITAIAIFTSTSALADLAIIVHPGYKQGELNVQDVKKLFLGERNAFPDGMYARPVNHNAGSPDREFFYESVLGMDDTSVLRHWRRQISTGKNNQPAELGSYQEVLNTVAGTAGSISYIDSRMVNSKVKVLMVVNENGMVDN